MLGGSLCATNQHELCRQRIHAGNILGNPFGVLCAIVQFTERDDRNVKPAFNRAALWGYFLSEDVNQDIRIQQIITIHGLPSGGLPEWRLPSLLNPPAGN